MTSGRLASSASRTRAVAELIRRGQEDLQRLAAENKSEQFHAALFRLLQEQLGERLDCLASAITEAVVDEKLRPRGVPDTTLQQIHELFQKHQLILVELLLGFLLFQISFLLSLGFLYIYL